MGFIYSPRRSFCADASWYVGPRAGGKMLDGVPLFAVEVRSPEDYGPAAERRLAAKRAAYFDCGTQVVWDVDALRAEVIRAYRGADPESADVYKRGEVADAEPAVPGWRFRDGGSRSRNSSRTRPSTSLPRRIRLCLSGTIFPGALSSASLHTRT